MNWIKIIILFFLISVSAQQNLSNNTQISLLTCDSGNELYSLFGHTGLRVLDPDNNLDIVYNFGMFDFSTPNFYLKFVKGDLMYFGSIDNFEDFMFQYQYFKRSVVEQVINLSPEEKKIIFSHLNQLLSTEEKYYQYKFIDENCTTKVQDVLNVVLNQKLIKVRQDSLSYRAIINGYLDNHFFEKLGINLIFGNKTDALATNIFLPVELEKSLDFHPKFKQKNNLLEYPKNSPFVWWNSIYVFIFIVLILTFLKPKILSSIWLCIQGILGLFFWWVGSYSFHQEVLNNFNILVLNPLLLLYVVFYVKKRVIKKTILLVYLLNIIGFIILCYHNDHFEIMLIFMISNLVIMLRNESIFSLLTAKLTALCILR